MRVSQTAPNHSPSSRWGPNSRSKGSQAPLAVAPVVIPPRRGAESFLLHRRKAESSPYLTVAFYKFSVFRFNGCFGRRYSHPHPHRLCPSHHPNTSSSSLETELVIFLRQLQCRPSPKSAQRKQ
ncbi:hypothetical protein BCR34DRAFT_51426 [Clohesyomyces aquaticus]|uniref:Uncharacterized protein n=1 Tax=Clohesyomyces aquaticus TaxID=1231657 RepID=A0A1Y2A468_9PLEO|nr:hypothetical protein BCR34DRAFT_51426 [Clohesyomyces aquaticus]